MAAKQKQPGRMCGEYRGRGVGAKWSGVQNGRRLDVLINGLF